MGTLSWYEKGTSVTSLSEKKTITLKKRQQNSPLIVTLNICALRNIVHS